MDPESLLYVFSHTFVLGIIIGAAFLAIGYFMTNPHLRRARQQLEHYKNECDRMARTLASINRSQKELLENIETKEQERVLLQHTLDTKDEELVGLLDRLNQLAKSTANPVRDQPKRSPEAEQEYQALREQVRNLSSRLQTSEADLRQRALENAELREELAGMESLVLESSLPSTAGNSPALEDAAPPLADSRESEILRQLESELESAAQRIDLMAAGSSVSVRTPSRIPPPKPLPKTESLFPSLSSSFPSGAFGTAAESAVATLTMAPTRVREETLFCSSSPALWDETFFGAVTDDMRYLRVRRMDTGESVILALRQDQLRTAAPAEQAFGWNGVNEHFEGARHLGIFDRSLPQEVETRFASGGWGFGHFYGRNAGQGYSWNGNAIPETEFEFSALTTLPGRDELRATKSRVLDGPMIAPSESLDLVIFRSSDPSIWNKNIVDGKGGFALGRCRVPERTQYIKVRRMDTREIMIVSATKEGLFRKAEDPELLAWNGSNDFFFGGHHLGISDPKSPEREVEIQFSLGGWGFGHVVDANNHQAYAWAGQTIRPTQFEFTAIARDLHPDEVEFCLNL